MAKVWHHSFKTGTVVYCGLKGSDLCRQFPFRVDMPNFLPNVAQLMQYNRPNVAIIHPSETITALTFATYLVEDTTETTSVLWVPWAGTDSPLTTHSRWHDCINKRCQNLRNWSWSKVWSTCVCKAFVNQLQKNITNVNIDLCFFFLFFILAPCISQTFN